MKMHYTVGTRPYAAHQEAYHNLNQEYPDHVKFFGMMHTRKDKTFVDPESEQHAANMDAALAALPEETRQTPAAKNQVFEQEFGDRLIGHGRVFGYGLGVTPSELGLKSSSSSLSRLSVDAEMADIQAQLAASKAEKESLAAEVQETKSDIAKLKETVDAQMLMLQQFRQEMIMRQRRVNRRMIEDDYFQQYGVPWQHTFLDLFSDSVVGVSGNANSQGFMPTSTTRHVLDHIVQQGEPNNALT